MQNILNLIYKTTKGIFNNLINFELIPGLNILVLLIGALFLIFFVKFIFGLFDRS